MSVIDLRRRLERVERERRAHRDGVRYAISAGPLGDDRQPIGPETDHVMTAEEWARTYCREEGVSFH